MSDSSQFELFAADVDGTVYSDSIAPSRFQQYWAGLPAECRPLLCYNSGRLIDNQLELIASAPLPAPDFIIGGVGTSIWDHRRRRLVVEYQETFAASWSVKRVREIVARSTNARPQPEQYQTRFKSSWYWDNGSRKQLQKLADRLREQQVPARIIYSSGRDLDLLPEQAGKGNALVWLCRYLNVDPGNVLTAGDTGNDLQMLKLPGVRGIVVSNAKPELLEAVRGLPVYFARSPAAEGVIEGLQYYGIVSESA